MQVHITFHKYGNADIELDGVNIAKHVRARDFRISMEPISEDGEPTITGPVLHLALRPEQMVVDGEIQPHTEFALALAALTDVQESHTRLIGGRS